MAAVRKEALRTISQDEHQLLEHLSQSSAEPAYRVIWAKELLAVEAGMSYSEAAERAGRRSNDSVSQLVSRFNQMGLAALNLRHGGGNPIQYGVEEQQKILKRFKTTPDKEQDGTATWSLKTLQMALKNRDHLSMSTYIIWKVLHENGYSWQHNRTWIDTGKTIRMHKAGPVAVEEIDRIAKKKLSRRRTRRLANWD
jgi:transposase